jgi:hypothetical protein
MEYYTFCPELDPPLDNVMDAFKKSSPRNDPTAPNKNHDKLNLDIIGSYDSTHHHGAMSCY